MYNHTDYIPKSRLPRQVDRFIKRKEADLGRKFTKAWMFENKEGNRYLMGRFCINRDRLIVTMACLIPGIGWVTSK